MATSLGQYIASLQSILSQDFCLPTYLHVSVNVYLQRAEMISCVYCHWWKGISPLNVSVPSHEFVFF